MVEQLNQKLIELEKTIKKDKLKTTLTIIGVGILLGLLGYEVGKYTNR
jgi:hypothetical protein